MEISLFQFNPEFGKKNENIAKILGMAAVCESDIIVFPELCTTGYDFRGREEARELAEPFKNDTIYAGLRKIASEKNKIIIYGFNEIDGLSLYNSCALVFPDENYDCLYRKTHLFFKERFSFNRGDTGFFVVDYKPFDLKIGPMICYDWRFPEAARTLALKGADLIVCPSNLVTNVWSMVMPARALENKVYVAVCNRTGKENRNNEELAFNGLSALYSYNGTPLAVASVDGEEWVTAEIEQENTRNKSFNKYNDIFKDRVPQFYYK